MTGHVFISYSRRDRQYARKLAQELRERGYSVWLDDRIDAGASWHLELEESIENCAVFVVIVTPDSRKSDWVSRELVHATNEKKKVIPLLLAGDDLPFLLNTLQFVDVRGGVLPPSSFYDMLAERIPSREEAAQQSREERQKRDAALERIRASGSVAFKCSGCEFPVSCDTMTGASMALLFGVPSIGGVVVHFVYGWIAAVAFSGVALLLLSGLIARRGELFKDPSRCPNCGTTLKKPLAVHEQAP
jgi:TIR domain